MPQKQKLNGRKLNKQGLKYQYMKQKKYFVYIFKPFTSDQILYSRLFIQTRTSIHVGKNLPTCYLHGVTY